MSIARARKPYPSDVSDEEWSLVVGYLTLMKEDAPQREYSLRELFNALRYARPSAGFARDCCRCR
jgi:transposase